MSACTDPSMGDGVTIRIRTSWAQVQDRSDLCVAENGPLEGTT